MSDTPAPAAPASPEATSAEPAEGTGEQQAGQPPKGMTAAQKKIWKLKADGEEFEFDASDEEAIKREITKARGAGKRFDEAAKMRRQAEQFFGMLKDPKKLKEVLTDPRVGVDLKKFAEEYVWEQIQEQQLTPEQKRQREVERELEKYKSEEKARKEADEQRQSQELHQKYQADYEKRIVSALETGGLPKTPATVQRMAYYMLQAVQNGYDLEPSDIVERVRQDYIEDVKSLFGQTDGDQLLGLLGDEVGKKIRETDLKKLRSTQGSQFKTPPPKASTGKGQPKVKRLSGKDWRDQLIRESKGK